MKKTKTPKNETLAVAPITSTGDKLLDFITGVGKKARPEANRNVVLMAMATAMWNEHDDKMKADQKAISELSVKYGNAVDEAIASGRYKVNGLSYKNIYPPDSPEKPSEFHSSGVTVEFPHEVQKIGTEYKKAEREFGQKFSRGLQSKEEIYKRLLREASDESISIKSLLSDPVISKKLTAAAKTILNRPSPDEVNGAINA